MSRLWWFWFCYWFESDVPEGPIVNEWNWPFTMPSFMLKAINYINIRLR